jgi:hypothetical protein
VVDGTITNELKNQSISLTLSNPYFSTDSPSIVQGASVRVVEGNNNYNFTEAPKQPGCYISDVPFAGTTGKTYNLLITLKDKINGQNEYTASSTMPEGLNIDSIRCEIYASPKNIQSGDNSNEKDTTILAVFYYGQEPVSSGNYYFAKIYSNLKPLFSNTKDYPLSDDGERNGAYVNFMAIVKNVAANDTITFNLFSINKDYYNYLNDISKMDMTGNISSPSGPPANALGNVDGALGFFLVSYVSTSNSRAIDKR